LFRRLCNLLATQPEVAGYLQVVFTTFQRNEYAWGLNPRGTAYSLAFLIENSRSLEKYAEIAAAASKKTPRRQGASKSKPSLPQHDRAAADEAYRQAAAASSPVPPPPESRRSAIEILSRT
jgi:hypothetical protein